MNQPQISNRIQSMPVSAVRKLNPYAAKAKSEGAKVFHLNIGNPDVKTPEIMLDVLRNWDMNPIQYAPANGTDDFLNAIQQYYRNFGYSFINKSQIITTVGGSEAIVMTLFTICSPEDEVLVFEPFYSGYGTCAAFTDVNLVPVPTDIDNGFHLPSREVIESKITPKTKAILYCSPGNPTGTVYTKEEIELLVSIAKDNNLFIISDEVYREYNFTDREHVSLLSYMEEIPELAILVDSLSKRYSLCGARLGLTLTLNQDIYDGIMKLANGRLSGGIIDQTVGAKMNDIPDTYIPEMQEEYKRRRDVLYEGMTKIEGVTMSIPEGAFYSMVELPVEDAEDFCIYLLSEYRNSENETVMLAPGAGFYATQNVGQNVVRMAYVLNTDDLNKCIGIITDALEKYKNK